ncbi:hypothetical protein A3Q56_03297, partial [Intoshia linei]
MLKRTTKKMRKSILYREIKNCYEFLMNNLIFFLFLFEIILNVAIIFLVKYTEIDWKTYMQQISKVKRGVRDYSKIYGNTGLMVFFTADTEISKIFLLIAVSVKMNILLFAPGYLFALIQTGKRVSVIIKYVSICAVVQLIIALPFLSSHPVSYIKGAFNIKRIFIYKWTVNWKMIPEYTFKSPSFHLLLLSLHVISLMFMFFYWMKKFNHAHHLIKIKKFMLISNKSTILPIFQANLIGIFFSRTLHYQFYSWYYHTIPFIIQSSGMNKVLGYICLILIEICWNVYPANSLSSLTLWICHFIIIAWSVTRLMQTGKYNLVENSEKSE